MGLLSCSPGGGKELKHTWELSGAHLSWADGDRCFTAGLCKALPAWSNPASLLRKSSWAGVLLLSHATNCQSWRDAGKHLEDVGHADEENADRQVPGISQPDGAAAATVTSALPSS